MLRVGLDANGKGELTAIAVVETEKRKHERGKEAVHHDLRYLERLPKGAKKAMRRMAEIVDGARTRNGFKRTEVFANVTVAGRSLLGTLDFNGGSHPRFPVCLEDGDERIEQNGMHRVGKRRLFSCLQKLIASREYRVLDAARTGYEQLQRELLARKSGDEPGPLMIALGLAVEEEEAPTYGPRPTGDFTVGVDMEENARPTAIAVVELGRRKDSRGGLAVYRDVWILERLSERSRHEAAERTTEIVGEIMRRDGGEWPTLYVNVTGPGMPGLAALRFDDIEPPMTPVYLKDGDGPPKGYEEVEIGKGWLVSRLQKIMADKELHLLGSARDRADDLRQEFQEYRPGDEPGPLMVALGLAVKDDLCEVRVIGLEGPGSGSPYRDLRAGRDIRDYLDGLS